MSEPRDKSELSKQVIEMNKSHSPSLGHPDAVLQIRDKLFVRPTSQVLREFGALWLSCVLGGVLFMSVLLLSIQNDEIEDLRTARLQITLSELRDGLEKNLSLGFDLVDNTQAQILVEQFLDRDKGLRAVEIFDPAGRFLFSTDRGSVGERVPTSWLSALEMSKRDHPWRVVGTDEDVLGIPLYGAVDVPVGYIAVTIAALGKPELLNFATHVFIAFMFVLVLGILALRWAISGDIDPQRDSSANAAADRILQAHVRLQITTAALRDIDAGPS